MRLKNGRLRPSVFLCRKEKSGRIVFAGKGSGRRGRKGGECEKRGKRKDVRGEQKRRDEYRDEKEKESVEGAERRKNDV